MDFIEGYVVGRAVGGYGRPTRPAGEPVVMYAGGALAGAGALAAMNGNPAYGGVAFVVGLVMMVGGSWAVTDPARRALPRTTPWTPEGRKGA